MAQEVFISHCPANKGVAKLVCGSLEASNIKCWLRFRDMDQKGDSKKSLEEAIKAASAMVVVFSAETNDYPELASEMNTALNADLQIIPMRVDLAEPKGVMDYYLADTQWFDVTNPPSELRINDFVLLVHRALKAKEEAARLSSSEAQAKKVNIKIQKKHLTIIALIGTIILIYGVFITSYGFFRLVSGFERLINSVL